MSTTLSSDLQARHDEREGKAEAEYVNLVRRIGHDLEAPRDYLQVERTLKAADKTPDDLEADVETFCERQKLRTLAATEPAVMAEAKRLGEASTAAMAGLKKAKQALRDAEAAFSRGTSASASYGSTVRELRLAKRDLNGQQYACFLTTTESELRDDVVELSSQRRTARKKVAEFKATIKSANLGVTDHTQSLKLAKLPRSGADRITMSNINEALAREKTRTVEAEKALPVVEKELATLSNRVKAAEVKLSKCLSQSDHDKPLAPRPAVAEPVAPTPGGSHTRYIPPSHRNLPALIH